MVRLTKKRRQVGRQRIGKGFPLVGVGMMVKFGQIITEACQTMMPERLANRLYTISRLCSARTIPAR